MKTPYGELYYSEKENNLYHVPSLNSSEWNEVEVMLFKLASSLQGKVVTGKCTCSGNTTNITPIECCPVHGSKPKEEKGVTDEKIATESFNRAFSNNWEREGFEQGAKWMRDKLTK